MNDAFEPFSAPAPDQSLEPEQEDPRQLQAYLNNPDRLHNDNVIELEIQKEKPWHRLLLYWKALGLSNRKAAQKLGVSEIHVGTISRQPWFRQKLVKMLKEGGAPAVREMIKGAVPESVEKLIYMRDHAKNEALQAECAMDLINRYLGKAPQIVAEGDIPADVDERVLDAQIAELQKRIKPSGPQPDDRGNVNN